jgi:hypothetical protein
MSFATTQVVGSNLDPKHALEMTRRNARDLGFENDQDATPVSLGTFRRHLRSKGLNRAQRRSRRVVHRRFEAPAPGHIFQCDVSGVKTRWVDVRNKRILQVHAGDVNANHPNRKSTRVPLFKFSVKDDNSRFLFTRFFAAERETSCLMVDLLLEAFQTMGVPLAMYTDNASVFKSQLTQRAASILDRGFAENGGFKWEFHAPYNPNAGGKIESSHQFVEQFEKYLGIGPVPTLDDLNQFAVNFCDLYNWTDHRTTREKPDIRFRAGHGVMRVAPPELLNDAFKAREFSPVVNSDVTISVEGVRWQLPRGARLSATLSGPKDVNNPFIDLAQSSTPRTIDVIWPIEAEWFVAIADGNEFTLAKIEAVADAAYEHKSVTEPSSVRNQKHFKALAADQRQQVAKGKQIIRPGIEVPFEIAAEARPATFPRQRVDPSLAEWANAEPLAAALASPSIDRWSAASMLQSEEILSSPLTAAESDWLSAVFNGEEKILESDLRTAVAVRDSQIRLAEVKSA